MEQLFRFRNLGCFFLSLPFLFLFDWCSTLNALMILIHLYKNSVEILVDVISSLDTLCML